MRVCVCLLMQLSYLIIIFIIVPGYRYQFSVCTLVSINICASHFCLRLCSVFMNSKLLQVTCLVDQNIKWHCTLKKCGSGVKLLSPVKFGNWKFDNWLSLICLPHMLISELIDSGPDCYWDVGSLVCSIIPAVFPQFSGTKL